MLLQLQNNRWAAQRKCQDRRWKAGAVAKFRVTNIEDARLPASVLVHLYIRLRAGVDGGEYSLDPNHKVRASIVMAILGAAEAIGSDIIAIEARVRRNLGQTTLLLAA